MFFIITLKRKGRGNNIKLIFNEFKKVDKKFLFLLLFSVVMPIIYSYIRLYFIVDKGDDVYAMSSFYSYIQAFLEIFMVFLIMPIFTYKKEEYKNKNTSLLFSVIIASVVIFFLLLTILNPLLKSMLKMNPDANSNDLKLFLLILMASSTIGIIEMFLIFEIALGKQTLKGAIMVMLGIFLKLIIDILMISNFAIIEFNIFNISLSSLISTCIISFVLLGVFLHKKIKDKTSKKIELKEMFRFYKRGIYPGINQLIANFFYVFVTLRIVNNLGEEGWNSWNLGMWIYWSIIFKLTNILKYSLISEVVNNKELDGNKLTHLYIYFDILIFAILGPLLSLTALNAIVENKEWLKQTTTTSLIMIPFMLSISIGEKLKIKMLVQNKYKYILINTMIVNFIIEFPVWIMLLLGFKFTFWENFIIWTTVISLSFIITIIFYSKLVKKEKNILDNKKYYEL